MLMDERLITQREGPSFICTVITKNEAYLFFNNFGLIINVCYLFYLLIYREKSTQLY